MEKQWNGSDLYPDPCGQAPIQVEINHDFDNKNSFILLTLHAKYQMNYIIKILSILVALPGLHKQQERTFLFFMKAN